MWTLGESQRNRCPEEYQARLTDAGGLNRYGDPNFKFYWGQTETFRAGGCWEVEDCPPFTGYRDLLLGSNEPCWMLMQWYPPEHYGTPESYFVQNYDEGTGLQTLGEFPYTGRYEIVNTLTHKSMVNGELVVERMPLNSLIVDLVIPTILDAEDVSVAKRLILYQADRDREDEELTQKIANALAKGRLAFGRSPVSYGGQKHITSVLDKKMDSLRRNWSRAMDMAKNLNKGITQS
jgi:hypothetical protein